MHGVIESRRTLPMRSMSSAVNGPGTNRVHVIFAWKAIGLCLFFSAQRTAACELIHLLPLPVLLAQAPPKAHAGSPMRSAPSMGSVFPISA
jgi:hypothetical protein